MADLLFAICDHSVITGFAYCTRFARKVLGEFLIAARNAFGGLEKAYLKREEKVIRKPLQVNYR